MSGDDVAAAKAAPDPTNEDGGVGVAPTERNVEVVRRLQAAYNRGDVDGVLAELDPAVEWRVPGVLPLGGVYRGHDALRRFLVTVFAGFAEPSIEPGELLDAGDQVVYLGRFTARARAGDRALNVDVAFVWDLRAGKITRMREYSDTATILRFFGDGRAG